MTTEQWMMRLGALAVVLVFIVIILQAFEDTPAPSNAPGTPDEVVQAQQTLAEQSHAFPMTAMFIIFLLVFALAMGFFLS